MKLSLGRLFVLATLAISIVIVGGFAGFVRRTNASILASSEQQRLAVAQRVETKVTAELDRAENALEAVERGITSGAIGVDDPKDLESRLFMRVLDDPHLEEVTFTRATLLSYDAKDEALIDGPGRWQLSVYRAADGRVTTRLTEERGDGFVASSRERGPEARFASPPLTESGTAADPTKDETFEVSAARRARGRAIWSDLHWCERDKPLPQERRRVVVSVQKAIEDVSGRFLGVARVGLLTNELDKIAQSRVDESDSHDPHRIALLAVSYDGRSHLVARVTPADRDVLFGDDLRVQSDHPRPEIAALLDSPLLQNLDFEHPNARGDLEVNGEPYLATLRELSNARGGTQGWFVAVLVPKAHYTSALVDFERTFLRAFAIILVSVLVIGGVTLLAVRRGLGRIVQTTTRMRAFDFAPSPTENAFREIDEVMSGLERAKTVVRAMGKYVPLDLVRRLYETNREPALGGELADVSLMFTDIEGFTGLSERLPPDELARRLGDYLEAMTVAIEKTGGTIDKYIGDAVMALWNVPAPIEGHAVRACRAARACMEAATALYASPGWAGLPRLVTRFGLHKANVMVGHFGAPTRLNYTVLGDGVNLAARLEPLCKQYGVVALASEDIVKDAREAFVFRRVDRVAVKGKTRGVDVYELLGAVGETIPSVARARRYEEAFEAYLGREFARAIDALAAQEHDDPPSAVLLARCRILRDHPPPDGWNGVHVASSK